MLTPRQERIARDLKNWSRDALSKWVDDTLMRYEAADIEQQEAVFDIMTIMIIATAATVGSVVSDEDSLDVIIDKFRTVALSSKKEYLRLRRQHGRNH